MSEQEGPSQTPDVDEQEGGAAAGAGNSPETTAPEERSGGAEGDQDRPEEQEYARTDELAQ